MHRSIYLHMPLFSALPRPFLMKCLPTCMWLLYGENKNHFTPPGCTGTAQVGLERVKNAISLGLCLLLTFFFKQPITQQKGVWAESITVNTARKYIFDSLCSFYLKFKISTRDCISVHSLRSSCVCMVIFLYSVHRPYCYTCSTLILPQWSIQIIAQT